MADDAWEQARGELKAKHAECLAAIAARYGHTALQTPGEVIAAIAAAMRAGFDLGVEFAHRRSTIPPPPPTDAEVSRG